MTKPWMTYEFKAPLDGEGGKITKLELKEPRAKLVRRYGMPFSAKMVDGSPDVNIDFDAVGNYLEELGNIDEFLLDLIPAGEFITISTAFVNKFTETVGNDQSS